VTLELTDGPMGLYVATPEGAPTGAVIVIQEAFGVTDHIEDVARRAAAAGYYAVAPHLFHRSGDPELSYTDIGAAMPHMGALTLEGILADLDATFAHLAEAGFGPERTGLVGFCMGGTVATIAAAERLFGASVAFYGGGLREGRFGAPPLIDIGGRLQTPWLGLYGDLDTGIPVQDVEAMRGAVAASAVDTEVVQYPNGKHGFHCDDRPDVFDPDSAKDGWHRTLEWFSAHLR
jgi:carboxymethylenebutenolidase